MPPPDLDEDLPTAIHQGMEAPASPAAVTKPEPAAPPASEASGDIPPPGARTAPDAKLEPRTPPHTPPSPKAATRGTESSAPAPAAIESSSELEKVPPNKPATGSSGKLGTFLLVALLLAVFGLVGASLMLEGTPDPRPLLRGLFE